MARCQVCDYNEGQIEQSPYFTAGGSERKPSQVFRLVDGTHMCDICHSAINLNINSLKDIDDEELEYGAEVSY